MLRGKRAEEPDRIIAVEPGDTTGNLYGLAVDIGTTTVCGVLIDLNSGEVIAEASAYNDQIGCGEDVISRIIYSQRPGGLKGLQEKVVRTINAVIETVCKKVMISPSDISYIMAAGNTIMSHLLLGLNPKYLRESPYVPTCSHFPLTRAASLGIHAHPSVRLFLYPAVASYVGGDIISGVHACQMYKSPLLTLFIDIGTNGEIVVGNEEWMVCAACSAGPGLRGRRHPSRDAGQCRGHREFPHPPRDPGADDHHHRPDQALRHLRLRPHRHRGRAAGGRSHRPAGQIQPAASIIPASARGSTATSTCWPGPRTPSWARTSPSPRWIWTT